MARYRYQKGYVYLQGQTWYGRYREDEIRDGQPVRVLKNVPLGGKKDYPTKRLAERLMAERLSRINSPAYRPGRVAIMGAFAEKWVAEVLSHRKPSTQKTCRYHLRRYILPMFRNFRMDAVGVENQQAFVTHVGKCVSGKTLANILSTLAAMLETAKNWGYVCEGVDFDRLVLPEWGVRQEARCFTAEQAQQIIAEAEMPWKLMFAIAAYTGLRASEIMGLRAEDVDLKAGIIHVTQTALYGKIQTAKTRASKTTVPIPRVLLDQLVQVRANHTGLLFVTPGGNPYQADKVVTRRLRPILDRLGIPRAGFHAFRHMHTALILRSGADPKVAQRQLRHSSASTTIEVYGHVVGDAQREVVEKAARYIH